MNVVFLSPHFPPNYYLFCSHLKKKGARVLGIADAAYDSLRPELREGLSEYYRVDDMTQYDQVLRACGYFTHVYGKINRVESLNDYWQETEACLREDFNIFGPKPHQIQKLIKKSAMKEVFRKAGIQVARGKKVKRREDVASLVEETGYPLVLKPDRGVGAANTFRIDSDAGLERINPDAFSASCLAEEFIQGELISFDGLTDRDGTIVFFTSHVFSQGIMETVNEDRDIFYYSVREVPEDLEDAGRRAVAAFAVRERFFHIEFFRTPDNRLVALEINARPPGGLTVDMFNFANNIDLYRQWAQVVIENRFTDTYTRPYHCGYIGRKLNKTYAHPHREIMQKYGYMIVYYGGIDSVFSAAIGNYAYVANATHLDELREVATFIQKTESRNEW